MATHPPRRPRMPTRIQKRSKLSNLQGATITRHKKENMRSVALPMRACARIVCNSCVLCLFFFSLPLFLCICTTTPIVNTSLSHWDSPRTELLYAPPPRTEGRCWKLGMLCVLCPSSTGSFAPTFSLSVRGAMVELRAMSGTVCDGVRPLDRPVSGS